MAIELEIRDGDPWWISPDIWVVLSTDPLAPPEAPVAGEPAYVWARVRNNGTTTAVDANVSYHWAPAGVVNFSATHPIGSAQVTLGPGEVEEVRCPSPWVPQFSGHACLIVAVFHQDDPLPPGGVVDVPADRHLAQRNVQVAPAVGRGHISGVFQVPNVGKEDQLFHLQVQPGKLGELAPEVWEQLGLPRTLQDADGRVVRAGLVDHRVACPTADDLDGATAGAKLVVRPGHAGAVRFAAAIKGPAALLHVTAHVEGRDDPVGGVTYVLLAEPAARPRDVRPRGTA